MKVLIILVSLIFVGCSRNVDWVKERAAKRWEELGYQVIAYEGYNWSPLCGGDVWHTLKRSDTPGVIYTGYLCKWGDELHVYGPHIVSGQQIQLNQKRSNDE